MEMNKKKILIIMPSMFIGGAERSLLGMLDSFDYSKAEVSLFLYRREGEFLKYIPEQVHILPEIKEYSTFDVPIKSLIFSKRFVFGIARIFSKIALNIRRIIKRTPPCAWISMQYTAKFLGPFLPRIPGNYDLAVMYLGIAAVLDKKVSADIKMSWNHTDYTKLHPNKKMDLAVYSGVDYIVSVSDSCRSNFLKVYPELKSKSITVENILSKPFIEDMANEPAEDFPDEKGVIKLLSVGRYSDAKNFDNVPFICRKIRENGFNAKWYIIGYGGDEELIKSNIIKTGMEDYVILLGKKENPYPYIKKCDVYIQPSRYEGKCVSVREAQILEKPVIITNYSTASSQLKDGYDGIIVNLDNEGCADGISKALGNEELLKMIADNTKKEDYTNRQELEKIYSLI